MCLGNSAEETHLKIKNREEMQEIENGKKRKADNFCEKKEDRIGYLYDSGALC